jgi:hypothetical protein
LPQEAALFAPPMLKATLEIVLFLLSGIASPLRRLLRWSL